MSGDWSSEIGMALGPEGTALNRRYQQLQAGQQAALERSPLHREASLGGWAKQPRLRQLRQRFWVCDQRAGAGRGRTSASSCSIAALDSKLAAPPAPRAVGHRRSRGRSRAAVRLAQPRRGPAAAAAGGSAQGV